MKNFIQQKGATAIIVVATIILAGIAIFTAVRLYQLRDESVSPATPESEPAANGVRPSPPDSGTISCTSLAFSLTTQTPTPTGSITSTPTPTNSITSTPTPTSQNTPTPTNSVTSTPTPTNSTDNSPTPTSTSVGGTSSTVTPTEAELPPAGIGAPTIVGFVLGGMLIVFSLVIAL